MKIVILNVEAGLNIGIGEQTNLFVKNVLKLTKYQKLKNVHQITSRNLNLNILGRKMAYNALRLCDGREK
jgi:hypothetical protein